jgi:hypothetical protein
MSRVSQPIHLLFTEINKSTFYVVCSLVYHKNTNNVFLLMELTALLEKQD